MEENSNRIPDSDDLTSPPARKRGIISTAFTVLLVLGLVGLLIALFLPAVRSAPEAGHRAQCSNRLKQIGLALQNYAAAHGAFPPAYTTDADGKPLHSWRTLILPYMDRKALYDSIDLTKPWDDLVNLEPYKARLDEYLCPAFDLNNRTNYLAVVTPNSCFRAAEPRSPADITDGASQTLMVIEVDSAHAVPWMMPVDADEELVLAIGRQTKTPHAGGVFGALFVDGSVHFFNAELTAAQRRALISIAGGDQALAKAALDNMD